VFSGQGTGRQRQLVLAVVVAMIVVGAAGCVVRDTAQGMVNKTDRNNFISSAESFAKAQNAYADLTHDPALRADLSKIPAATLPSIDAMKHAAAQMATLADKVTGSAHAIAITVWQAASGSVNAAERQVAATAPVDVDASEAAVHDFSLSIHEFNKARREWNAL
jgi:hypothetical protein